MKRKTEPLTLDKESREMAGLPPDNSELLTILQALQKKFVPHSEMHNQLAKAIKLAQ
jgi:hypothetical protein